MIDINIFLILAPALFLGVLSGYLSERVGIINIAINGMMIFGSVFFNIFSNVFYLSHNQDTSSVSFNLTFLASLLISSILGLLIGLLFGLAVIKFKCDHVIGGTAINLLAPGIGLIISDSSSIFFEQPSLSNKYTYINALNINGVHLEAVICFVISILMLASIYFVMNFTKYGLRFRSIGENPNAADTQSINVIKYKWIAMLVVGFISSFAGALFSYRLSGSAFTGDVDGLGFIALALLIVSSWKILPGLIISLIFSYLYVYASQTIIKDKSIQYVLRTIPFILTLLTMIIFGRFSLGPKALGLHFNKSLR